MPEDLAALLQQAIDEHRQEINASPLATGQAGRVEIDVNLTVKRIGVQIRYFGLRDDVH